MGQACHEYRINPYLYKPLMVVLRNTFFCLCLVGLMAGCSEKTLWVESGESCIFESEMPPLRRVINYVDPDLCDRQAVVKKKRQKRLRELLDEE